VFTAVNADALGAAPVVLTRAQLASRVTRSLRAVP
jgi:hypothetical protein